MIRKMEMEELLRAMREQGWETHERPIQCANCQQPCRVLDAAAEAGHCPRCKIALCVFCGCNDEMACLHPDFPGGEYRCEWASDGTCTFCHYVLVEELFWKETGQTDKIAKRYQTEDSAVVRAA